MAVNANDVIKAVWEAENDSPFTQIRQAFYWRATDPGDGIDANIAADLNTRMLEIWATVNAILTADYIGIQIKYTNETQRKMMPTIANNYGGTDNGNDLPGPDCALAIARTGNLGQQGRKFIGPIAVASQSQGALQAFAITAVENFAAAWSAQYTGPVSGAVFDPGVARYPGNLQPPTFTPFDPDLSSAIPRTRTMKRRRQGVGI